MSNIIKRFEKILLEEKNCKSLNFSTFQSPLLEVYNFADCHSLQCKRIFGERTLVTFSCNVWPLSWILKTEEGWGQKEINLY